MDILLLSNKLAHDIGIALGLGGATIAFIISRRADRNPKSASVIMPLIQSISKLIWLGLLLLIVSGVGLMLTVKWPMNSTLLAIKHVLVVFIIINGIYLGKAGKKLAVLVSLGREDSRIGVIKKRVRFVSIFNMFLWYLVIILSVIL